MQVLLDDLNVRETEAGNDQTVIQISRGREVGDDAAAEQRGLEMKMLVLKQIQKRQVGVHEEAAVALPQREVRGWIAKPVERREEGNFRVRI